jgi:hypothetical protein
VSKALFLLRLPEPHLTRLSSSPNSLLAGSYYIFDTGSPPSLALIMPVAKLAQTASSSPAMSQKSIFRMEQQGLYVPRASFPQLPWRKLENPKYIETKHGNKLLISGWWRYVFSRKPFFLLKLELTLSSF